MKLFAHEVFDIKAAIRQYNADKSEGMHRHSAVPHVPMLRLVERVGEIYDVARAREIREAE